MVSIFHPMSRHKCQSHGIKMITYPSNHIFLVSYFLIIYLLMMILLYFQSDPDASLPLSVIKVDQYQF